MGLIDSLSNAPNLMRAVDARGLPNRVDARLSLYVGDNNS
jgi:hypothetical protein